MIACRPAAAGGGTAHPARILITARSALPDENYNGHVRRIPAGIGRNQFFRDLGYVYRIFFLTHGSVGVLILAILGFVDIFSRNENPAIGALLLAGSVALLAVLAKFFYMPFILHGRLPSGRFLADVRADREGRRRVREAREAYMARYRR